MTRIDPAQERHRLDGFPTVEIEKEQREGGLLLSDQIAALCGPSTKMIEPFDRAMLRAASYRLRVGVEFRKGNSIGILEDADGKRELRLEPGEVVVVQTLETINLPRFIVARWNMKVDLVYKGLLWVGGPQVDPGWLGHLQCPIYNLSGEPVVLTLNEPFAIMDFQRTTPFRPEDCIAYQRPPQKVTMAEYVYGDVRSPMAGAVAEVNRRVIAFEKSIERQFELLSKRVRDSRRDEIRERDEFREAVASAEEEVVQLRQSVFTVMAVFVAAVGALTTAVAVFVAHGGPYVQPSWFDGIATGLLLTSVVAAVYAAVRTSRVASLVKLVSIRLNRHQAETSEGPDSRLAEAPVAERGRE